MQPSNVVCDCLYHVEIVQIGIGLLVLQQLSGINAILFYASNIFKAAGEYTVSILTSWCTFLFYLHHEFYL